MSTFYRTSPLKSQDARAMVTATDSTTTGSYMCYAHSRVPSWCTLRTHSDLFSTMPQQTSRPNICYPLIINIRRRRHIPSRRRLSLHPPSPHRINKRLNLSMIFPRPPPIHHPNPPFTCPSSKLIAHIPRRRHRSRRITSLRCTLPRYRLAYRRLRRVHRNHHSRAHTVH